MYHTATIVKISIAMAAILPVTLAAKCQLPRQITSLLKHSNVQQIPLRDRDVQRNKKSLSSLCVYGLAFDENGQRWRMTLVYDPKHPKGPFWLLPHDNENTAFDTAVYAVKKYGGGLLSIETGDRRNSDGQDPNRNYSKSQSEARQCARQKHFSPKYTTITQQIIDAFKPRRFPYLAMHNNADKRGSVSMLVRERDTDNYPAYQHITHQTRGLADEDSLLYLAGRSPRPSKRDLSGLHKRGLNFKYERVSIRNNDCSFSKYVVLNHLGKYYNIEAQHGDAVTQRKMVDRLIDYLKKYY